MRNRVRAIVAALALVLFAPTTTRADAIGPPPVAEHCVRGSRSTVANEMSHGQFAYCAPWLVGPGAACWEGHRHEVVELSIGERVAVRSGGHGPPRPIEPGARLAEVLGPCDAPDDETPITAPARGGTLGLLMSGPSITDVPAGCHRVETWVEDAEVHCEPVAAPTTTTPSEVVEEPTLPTPPAPPSPAPTQPTSAAPATAPTTTCACGVARGPDARGWILVLALVALGRARSRAKVLGSQTPLGVPCSDGRARLR